MPSTTGIELGPDSCVLAGVRTTRAGSAEIIALHTIEPAVWPAHDLAFVEMLRGIRRSKRFPTRTRVVAWGLPEDASDDDVSRAAVRPLVDAGFRVDRIVTPPQALAILAETRARPGVHNTGVAWLALNMHGVAIAIVRGAELLFARTFQWTYNPHLLAGKAQLLQRYSLIAQLAPEVRRGIAAVRASHGIRVDAAVTCGDLPELRSLTMPLIEELDLEVETLDSLEGLRPVGKAKLERLVESAPAIRLACATALGRVPRPRGSVPPVARFAAAAALVAVAGFGAYAYFNQVTKAAAVPRTTQTTSNHATKTAMASAAQHPPSPRVLPKTPPGPETTSAPPQTASTAKPSEKSAAQRTLAETSPPVAPRATSGARPGVPLRSLPSEQAAKVDVPKPSVQPPPRADLAIQPEQQTSRSTDRRDVAVPRPSKPAPEPRQAPLKDPLPRVESILIDQERRLAIIDGSVAAVGARVGSRVIVQIERDAIVMREPSGLIVRIPMRSRQGS